MEYDKRLYESLEAITHKYDELTRRLETANISIELLKDINKQLKRNKPIVDLFRVYKSSIKTAIDNENALNKNELESELTELVKLELDEIKAQIPN
jgi:peptide chain release factor 1